MSARHGFALLHILTANPMAIAQNMSKEFMRLAVMGRDMMGIACFAQKATSSYKGKTMRLPLIAPADLTPEQKPLYEDMKKGIAGNFNAFQTIREDGALMGPCESLAA